MQYVLSKDEYDELNGREHFQRAWATICTEVLKRKRIVCMDVLVGNEAVITFPDLLKAFDAAKKIFDAPPNHSIGDCVPAKPFVHPPSPEMKK